MDANPPPRRKPDDLAGYLEALSRPVFQAGISRRVTGAKWDGIHDGFDRYLRAHGGFNETVADIKRQFPFIGDSGAYHFLWSVGEPTPPYNEWFDSSQHKTAERRGAPAD